MNKRIFSSKAFTLIEILVVVLIIGILVAIALPKYQIAVEKAIMREAMINVKNIARANTVFFMQTGRYANAYEMDKLDITIPGQIITNNSDSRNRVETKYFVYSPDSERSGGSINNPRPQGNKAFAHRLPYAQRYFLSIIQTDPDTKVNCIVYNSATDIQKKLCNQLNNEGYI